MEYQDFERLYRNAPVMFHLGTEVFEERGKMRSTPVWTRRFIPPSVENCPIFSQRTGSMMW